MISEHPIYFAQELAKLLESDPIAVSQIKEHIKPERLYELLGLRPLTTKTVEEAVENCDEDEDAFRDYFEKVEDVAEMVEKSQFTEEQVLKFIISRFSRTELLHAINEV